MEDSQFFTGAGEQSQLLLSSTADSSLAASKDDEATGIGRFCLVAFCLLFVVLVGVLVVVFLNSDFREEKVDNTDEDIFGGSDGGSRTGGSGGSTSRRTPLPVYLTPRTTGDQRRTVPRGQARPGVPAVPVVPATPGMPVSPGAPTEPGVTAGRGVPAGTGVPEGPGVTAGTQPPARPRVPITTPPLTTSRMLTSKHTSPPTMPTTTSTPKITTTSIPIMTVGPNTKRPLPLDSLICTLESPFGGSLLRIPPDGLCSIVVAYPFYDPDALELFQTKKYSSKGFDILVEKAGKQNKTEFGIGISYKFCKSVANMTAIANNPKTKTTLDYLWTKRFYHYGQVNPPLANYGGSVNEVNINCVKGLQMLFNLMKDKNDNVNRPSYIIHSFPLFAPGNFPNLGQALRNLSVDIFIAVGYQSDPDNNYTACHMVPPNLLNKQLLTPDLYGIYSVRLADVISSLTENPAAWTPTTSFAVSVGLEGRWYTPKDQDGDYQLGMPCTNEIPAWIGKQAREIEMACYNRFYNFTFKIDQKFQAMVGYDKIDGLLFTFDTAETLRSKLCEAKSTATATKFYIVAANIGAVDYDNWCGFGALRRLHMLKALAHFFAYNYTSAAQKSACLLVNP
ncbi:uncharacterized protein [Dermacentor albipictus]|uniref:uncharacterized protein isoform X2 n=1 Tax=Dermacentor albipictus TaxID=60249 RepID=UPI0038FC1CC5